MSLVVCEDVGLAFGATGVFAGIDLRIEARDRLAAVGANGAGKTSLLEILAGLRDPTSGSVERQRGLRVGYLPQDAPEPVAEAVLDEVMASRADLAAMHDEMQRLEQSLERGGIGADDALRRYGDVQHSYQDAGGYELEARAREALGGLDLHEEILGRHPSALSGGQKRRVELAKLLVQDADLLLIDEPTNHLDLARRTSSVATVPDSAPVRRVVARPNSTGWIALLLPARIAARVCASPPRRPRTLC
jgi:ATP-binding cassette subfamily F protein 3